MDYEIAQLIGCDERHLVEYQGHKVHVEVVRPLAQLQQQAAAAGFDLAIASGFRSFSRQQWIWNQKAQGLRPLLDDNGQPLEAHKLTEQQRLFAILRWSALPGASRHHWGSDVDIYDAAALAPGDRVQLTAAETTEGGPFAKFHQWLDHHLATGNSPFFRPYVRATGGVAPEPWHLSYAPVARKMQNKLTFSTLQSVLAASDILLKEVALTHLREIYERFVYVPDELWPMSY